MPSMGMHPRALASAMTASFKRIMVSNGIAGGGAKGSAMLSKSA